MPNEQTSVPLFAASEILTAANMNISAGTGVPVFSGTAARNSAFGGVGEKTLSEGQLCYLSDTNVVQFYNGTSWINLGLQGFNFISKSTGTTVTSLSLPAGTFSSTYLNYKVIMNLTVSSVSALMTMRFRIANTDNTAASYDYAQLGYTIAGAAANTNGNGTTAFPLNYTDPTTSQAFVFSCDVLQPNTAGRTQVLGAGYANTVAPAAMGFNFNAQHRSNTSFDSLSLIAGAGTFTADIYVYGYNN